MFVLFVAVSRVPDQK